MNKTKEGKETPICSIHHGIRTVGIYNPVTGWTEYVPVDLARNAPELLEVLKEARYKIAAYAASDAAKWTSDVEKINAHSAKQCQEIDAIIAKATIQGK